jgi:hypothetical protein
MKAPFCSCHERLILRKECHFMGRQKKVRDTKFDLTRLDPQFQERLVQTARQGTIACASVFDILTQVDVSPSDAGKSLDALDIGLTHCQLGLFGYLPEKKIVKPVENPDPELRQAIQSATVDNTLSCEQAWNLARIANVPKMKISGICEAIGIRIKPCQLGAF